MESAIETIKKVLAEAEEDKQHIVELKKSIQSLDEKVQLLEMERNILVDELITLRKWKRRVKSAVSDDATEEEGMDPTPDDRTETLKVCNWCGGSYPMAGPGCYHGHRTHCMDNPKRVKKQ